MADTTSTPAPMVGTDLRNYVLACDDMKYEKVIVPEWNNAEIWVRSLTAEEKDAFEESITYTVKERRGRKQREKIKVDQKQLRAKLVIVSACVGQGNPAPLFNGSDLPRLSSKNGAALDRLFETAQRMSGFTDDDMDALGNG